MSSSEQKRVVVSVMTSVAVHLALLLVAVIMIAVGGFLPPEPAQASRPNEVVIYLPELVPEEPPAPENDPENRKSPTFVRTSEANRAVAAPAKAIFESDRNTLAATAGGATGPEPLPSQDGIKSLRVMELEDREHVDGEEANEAAADAAAAMRPPALPTPLMPTPMPDTAASLAMATPTLPSPLLPESEVAPRTIDQGGETTAEPRASELMEKSFSDRFDAVEVPTDPLEEKRVEGSEVPMKKVEEAPEERTLEDAAESEAMARVQPAEPVTSKEPSPQNPGFRPHTRATEIRGTLSNRRGRASFDAAETPLGRYKASVDRAIGKLWHRYAQDNAAFVVYGSIQLEFKVDRNGKPRDLQILKNDTRSGHMADFTLEAILKADIPPMPEEILDHLPNETLNVTYDVIIY